MLSGWVSCNVGGVALQNLTEDTTRKRAQTKAKQEALAEAIANYELKQKLYALELLLNDPESRKAPTDYLKGQATRTKKAEEAAKSLAGKGGN